MRSPKLPPAWKVRREIARPFARLGRRLQSGLVDPARQALYDPKAIERMTRLEGEIPFGDQVAIFVVFQPKGVANSIHHTLQHLVENGWAPVVVSNGSLKQADRLALAARASLVVERRNFGYDFGGYRDGLFLLEKLQLDPERIVLMNDSTWFPLRKDDDTLQRLTALDVDFAGQIFKNECSVQTERDHMESHLLMIGKEWRKSDSFRSFWSEYRLSNSRERTIEHGEKGLSRLALKEARHDATLTRDKFMEIVRRLSDEELLDVSRNMATQTTYTDHRRFRPVRRMEEEGRAGYEQWIYNTLSDAKYHFINSTFIYPAVKYGGLGFVKKSSDIRFQPARIKLLELLEAGKIDPIDPVVEEEIRRATESWRYRERGFSDDTKSGTV